MATKAFKWRTTPSGTEGVQHVFVHEKGSDEFGDGTRQHPYRTIGARKKRGTPTRTTCIGVFSEPLLNGNHSETIEGDYYGAATFDGKGIYCPYGQTLHNFRIINTGIDGIGHGSLAGVGRASNAYSVGGAYYVAGVASSFCFMDSCLHYMGVLGATYNINLTRLVYSRAKVNEGSYRLSLGRNTESTFANMPDQTLWQKTIYGNQPLTHCIFGNSVVVINYANTYNNCFFTSDVKFWCFKGNTYNKATDVQITPEGATSDERKADLIAKIQAVYAEWGTNAVLPTFNSCIFSAQTSKQVFVDPDHQCYNLKYGCEAVTNAGSYYGALPPAIGIPMYTNSAGIKETFDERTASGCIKFIADENITPAIGERQPALLCLDEASNADHGEAFSKIITINPHEMQLSGVYAFATSKFNEYAAQLNRNSVFTGTEYEAGDSIPEGRYKVRGSIILTRTISGEDVDTEVGNGGNIEIDSSVTAAVFADNGVKSYLMEYGDPNHMECLYCRCRSTIYAYVQAGQTLYQNVTYLNTTEHDITYHSRTIAPGESFVCEFANESFSCEADANARIAVMFDDRTDIQESQRIVPTSEFIPAYLWGSYFVNKAGGVMQHDTDGIPVSSGNYLSYIPTSQGGYSDRMHKSIMNQRFLQFAVFVTKHPTL
jgi:hypothetical protein